MTNTENNVAAQAGDEPMRAALQMLFNDRDVLDCITANQRAQVEIALASPRATTAVTEALQVCVKALEFRKERSANDEFALNLARIALAEAPRATADVERVMMECLIALSIGYTQTNDDGDEVCADCDLDHASTEDHSPGCLVLRARAARAQLAAIATTKPGA